MTKKNIFFDVPNFLGTFLGGFLLMVVGKIIDLPEFWKYMEILMYCCFAASGIFLGLILKRIRATHEKDNSAIREEIHAIREEIREKERKNSEEIHAIREEIHEIERKNSNVFKTLFVENMIHDEAMKILNTRQEKPIKDVCNSVALQLSRKLNVPVSEIDKILYRYFPEVK